MTVLARRCIRLAYADCDPAGILYFAAWFPWMERVQTEWFFEQGLRQDTLLAEHGFATVTRHTECEYLIQVGLLDEIEITASMRRLGRTSVTFGYEMRATSEQVLVARGSITVVTIGADGRPVELPEVLRDAVECAEVE